MSLGKDLATIRKSQNLSLEDIQNAIKIPLDTLKSIEDGSIFEDYSKNKTYIRSFVRSYAKTLKLDDEDVVQALDEVDAGTYSGSLIAGTNSPKDYASASDVPYDEDSVDEDAATFSPDSSGSKPEPRKQPVPPRKASSDPEVNAINWADIGRKFTAGSNSSKAWMIGSFLIIVGLLFGSAFIFWDDITSVFDQDPAERQEQTVDTQLSQDNLIPAPVDSPAVEDQDPPLNTDDQPPVSNEPITLGDTLTLTVYAAYGQLEPVRVTSDFNWRTNPFWMEEGEAYNFDFKDTLLVRGQYSRILLLFNGHVIENPRQEYFNTAFNSVMITRSVLDQPDLLAPAPREFPLDIGAPDSTVYRIRY